MLPIRALARSSLLVVALLLLLALPRQLAPAEAAQHSEATRPVSRAVHMGATPGNAGAHMAGLQPAPVQQASAGDVVISEFRFVGSGGEGDEFVEIFNQTCSTTINLKDWRIGVSSGAITTVLPASPFVSDTFLGPGQYLLLAPTTYDSPTPAVPPDFDPGSSVASSDGGFALFLPDGVTAIDQVGVFADGGGYVEGSSLAPLAANVDQGYRRKVSSGGVYVDTGDNAADFEGPLPSDPQNSSAPATPCTIPTATNTPTSSPTNTATPTNTPICPAPSVYPALSAIINEVAWSGTQADATHEWIELYNPDPACRLELAGWRLFGIRSGGNISFEILFDNTDHIDAGGYFIIAPGASIFQNVTVDRDLSVRGVVAGGAFGLIDNGMILYLRGPNDELVDSANFAASTVTVNTWPAGSAGSAANRRSMERYRVQADTRTNWVTFFGDTSFSGWPLDENGARVKGTPRRANWAFSVTVTPSPVATKVRTPTPRPPTPFAHMVINEFLPRAGTDWNQDGETNVYDEFIELKNLGPIDVDLAGWTLDDMADGGSAPYTLPSAKLKPGERRVFYGLETRILLEDSGDTVRLLNKQKVVVDARGYGIVEKRDVSHCRLPDGYYWRDACFATPGNENALTGVSPAPAPIRLSAALPCLLADTVPAPFRDAECNGFGSDMWDRSYWDEPSAIPFSVPDPRHKWKTSVE